VHLGNVVRPLLGVADVEDLHDPRIVYAREQPRLALEALDPDAVLGPPRLDHLDGDLAVQAPVEAAIDAPKGAFADQLEQLVAPVERAAYEVWCDGHPRRRSLTRRAGQRKPCRA
jgi:hypothetical protein